MCQIRKGTRTPSCDDETASTDLRFDVEWSMAEHGYRDPAAVVAGGDLDATVVNRALHSPYTGILFLSPFFYPVTMSQSTLPLIPPYPLVLLPGARTTFPISQQTSQRAHPAPQLVPLQSRPRRRPAPPARRRDDAEQIGRHRPRAHSDEPYLLTFTSTAFLRLSDSLLSHAADADALSHPRSTLFIHLRTHTHYPRPTSCTISRPPPSAC